MPNLTHPPHSGQVSLAYLQPLAELVAEHGVARSRWMQAAGLPATLMDAGREHIPAGAYLQLLDAAAEVCADPHIGLHVGERVKLGTYNIYGMILMSCPDFEDAFRQTIRYESLAHDLGRSQLLKHGDIAEYQWHSHFPQASRHLVESVFAGIRTFGHWFAGTRLPDVPVNFRHTTPGDTREHQRIFGQQLSFNAEQNSAQFPAALLHWRVPNADTGMYPVLQQHAEQLLRQKNSHRHLPEILLKVRERIAHHLAQDMARVAVVAEDLKLSARTLQRKLSDAGSSFQLLLDQTREQMARDYLKNPELTLADIAFLLGYQEQSTFQHAFKEWTGVTPGQFRSQLHEATLRQNTPSV